MPENLICLAKLDELGDRKPLHRIVSNTDLVIIKYDNRVSVLYGRCQHRGALMSDGRIVGQNLVCGLHNWDYRLDTGVSEYNNSEYLHKFHEVIKNGEVLIDFGEVKAFEVQRPQPFNREAYLGTYADTHPEETEPYTRYIGELSRHGLKNTGMHGFSAAMGVDRNTLPQWQDIQFLPAQMAKKPLLDDQEVNTSLIIGPSANKPLELSLPLFVSDMSFGALSREAKIALARGAEMAGTGICSGEGGMLTEEQESNSRYFYELASAQFGFSWDKLDHVQAFHFKGGQGAKTGTGGHLPGSKVTEEIAAVRGLESGHSAISPATFTEMKTVDDFKEFADKVRDYTGGIPIGFKLAASHIEEDIQFALDVGVDYIILDGRGGGTGAAPTILRDNINVPTIPALARARKYLDAHGDHVTLIITGGLRIADDFCKALMLGADGVALANSAIQAIGCLGMRACNTNNCPVGIATQNPDLRKRIDIQTSAFQLNNFLTASRQLIQVVARACGHSHIDQFSMKDLSTYNYQMHQLTGIPFAGTNGN